MVDLETLGLAPDSIIVSIGAVVFDERGIQGEGSWNLHLVQPDRHLDVGTVKWWMQQSDEARKVFSRTDAVALSYALEEFSKEFDKDTRIWCNGANFDEVLLANAYRQMNRGAPWAYKNVRCFRTVRAMYPDVKIEESGVKHNALADATWQANLLIEICKQKGIQLP